MRSWPAILLSVCALVPVIGGCCRAGTRVPVPPRDGGDAYVLLVHGLARSACSMRPMARSLQRAGFGTLCLAYPSTSAPVADLADAHLLPAFDRLRASGARRIHVVTHSMGGILLRSALARHDLPGLGRVVMLAPPNRGSEVVDRIGDWWLFGAINGPAGRELGTGADGIAARLPPIAVPCLVIAGDRSINRINSAMIPGPDDGKVAVARTGGVGELGVFVVHAWHPTIMRHRRAQAATAAFLRHGTLPDHSRR